MQPVRRAFTLIELLAVVVILSITAGMGLIALSNVHGEARLERIGLAWRELDARSRTIARQGRSSPMLEIESAVIQAENLGEWGLVAIAIPDGVQAQCEVAGLRATRVLFDTRGCSPDYTLSLTSEARRKAWRVSGETGWIEAVREETP